MAKHFYHLLTRNSFLNISVNRTEGLLLTYEIYNSSLTLKTILAAGTAALCGILVTSLVEYSWYYPRVMVMFWVLLGIIAAATYLAELKNRRLSEMD